MRDPQVDVVVIGAGFAGLSAARAIADAGRSVAVLEARTRVGGRTCTEEHLGTPLDLGGQWLGPGQDRIAALAEELGFETCPQSEDGDDVILEGARARRVADVAVGFDDEELVAYLGLVTALEEIAEQLPIDAPWTAPGAAGWDATNLTQWVAGRHVPERAAALFEVGVRAVFAASGDQLSLLHAAHYVHSAGGWSKLTDTAGGAQQDRIRGGMQPVAERLAGTLPEGSVRLGCVVAAIRHGDDGVVVEVVEGDRRWSLAAERAVVAIPPTLAGRITYDPPLGGMRDQLLQRMPQGSVVKFHVLYDTPWWRDEGLSGMVLAPGAPIGVTFDCTPPEGSPGVITGFFEGPDAVAAGEQSQQERRDTVVGVLTRALGDRARDVLGYVDRDWSAEPFTRGCYGAHLPPGALSVYGPALRRPIGPLHWAGTETAQRWGGYIDGAIESGRRAADEVLAALG